MYLVIISKTKSITNASNKNKIKIFFYIITIPFIKKIYMYNIFSFYSSLLFDIKKFDW